MPLFFRRHLELFKIFPEERDLVHLIYKKYLNDRIMLITMLRQQGVMKTQNYVHLQTIKLRALIEITSPLESQRISE
jgi:hypothetical protein